MLQKRLISLSCVATYSSLHQCDSVNKTASLWRLENCSTLALSDVEGTEQPSCLQVSVQGN